MYYPSAGPSAESLASRLRASSYLLPPDTYGDIHAAIADLRTITQGWERIRAVLADAEKQEVRNTAVRDWLRELRDLDETILDLHDRYDYELASRNLPIGSALSPLLDASFHQDFCRDTGMIRERFNTVIQQRESLCLQEAGKDSELFDDSYTDRPETHPGGGGGGGGDGYVFVGRKKETAKLMELLLAGSDADDPESIAVIGMGGIGKTTLVRRAYNDSALEGRYQIKAWVYASRIFDTIRLTEAVIRALGDDDVDPSDSGPRSLADLQEELAEKLQQRTALLVVDDLWNLDTVQWETFAAPFLLAGAGSKILVTARDREVADIARAVEQIRLEPLSEDEGWVVLRSHAFGDGPQEEPDEEMEILRRRILRKCRGLPLAIEVVGRLLWSMGAYENRSWTRVADASMLEFREHRNAREILGSLYLSYLHLSPKLKICFKLCSIYSRYKVVNQMGDLIKFLIAYNFAKDDRDASRILQQLQSRAFVKLADSDIEMHDLFHNIAWYVLGEKDATVCEHENLHLVSPRHASLEFLRKEACECLSTHSDRLHAFSVTAHEEPRPEFFIETFNRLKYLRVLGFHCRQELEAPPLQIFHLYNLQYLDLNVSGIKCLPDSISNLRRLKWLSLTYSDIDCLPESLSMLVDLQELNLSYCREMKELPEWVCGLTNLQILDLKRSGISRLPSGVRSLSKLQYLADFFCPEVDNAAAGLAELKHMEQLRKISVKNLKYVEDQGDAIEAEMGNKKGLLRLKLYWGGRNWRPPSDCETDEQVFHHLKPHCSIEDLYIVHYTGYKLPAWMGDQSLTKLVKLQFSKICYCTSLSPVEKLPSLEFLRMSRMPSLSQFPEEPQGSPNKPFPELKRLHMTGCGRLDTLDLSKLTSLDEVRIDDCENLEDILPPPGNASIRISGCPLLQNSAAWRIVESPRYRYRSAQVWPYDSDSDME